MKRGQTEAVEGVSPLFVSIGFLKGNRFKVDAHGEFSCRNEGGGQLFGEWNAAIEIDFEG